MRDALADIRQAVFDRSDTDPSGTTSAVDRANRFINKALQQLCLDAPFLFWDEQIRFGVQPDYEVGGDEDTVTLVFDGASFDQNEWAFRATLPTSDPDSPTWDTGGGWDGRLIDITDDDGTVHTRRIRTTWLEEDIDPPGSAPLGNYYMLSLYNPWFRSTLGSGPFTYRVYTPEYYLPDDVIQIRSMRVVSDTYLDPIKVIAQDEAERGGIVDPRRITGAGVPRYAFRRGNFSIPAPNVAPDVVLGSIQTPEECWFGPEPPGTFQYCLTYVWGERSIEYLNPGRTSPTSGALSSSSRQREPKWESSPSPISSEITTTGPDPNFGPAAILTLPNIEYMQGFSLDGSTDTGGGATAFDRYTTDHSGWRIRIWRKRITEDFENYGDLGTTEAGASITGLTKLDIHDEFFLLTEYSFDGQATPGQFIDDGSIIPDYHRRLRNVHGYQALAFYPAPDDGYQIECRVVRRPQLLVSESDAPNIRPEAIDVLVESALAKWYEHLKEPGMRAAALAERSRLLETLRKRYGDMRPISEPIRKRPARVRGYTRRNDHSRFEDP